MIKVRKRCTFKQNDTVTKCTFASKLWKVTLSGSNMGNRIRQFILVINQLDAQNFVLQ